MPKDYGLTNDWKALVTEHLLRSQKPLIVIVGPTASGKTVLALEVASHSLRGAEILNADSRQFFRGFDIGTAKITKKQMGRVPHHFVDILLPSEKPTIAWYKKEASECIDAILARGNVPILCGGSMLYVSSIIDGLSPVSPVDPGLREKLSHEYDRDKGVTLHERLAKEDPATAARIPRQNKVHLIRALEILDATGKKPSSLKKKSVSPYDLLILGISVQKKELDARIASRTHQMFAQGWVEEVAALLQSGVSPDDPAMESVGYREIAESILKKGVNGVEGVEEIINRRTRQYAKRQMTWWKGDERIQWIYL